MSLSTNHRLSFASDYMEGAHPAIMKRLLETNLEKTAGYGLDPYSDSAREKIRTACGCPNAAVHFLTGGTQTNAAVIDALLKSCQGVIAPASGHIATHEAGAIEFGGHKVLSLAQKEGKITARDIDAYVQNYYMDANHEHMVMPGMVYLSQPTEYGTLYSLRELEEISSVCHANHLYLYVDGARLAYALACPENTIALPDLARLCDVFYIGGTKCGALFGEAVVIPKPDLIPHFFSIIKQHGALLAKGRLLGLQFDTLFTDDLYGKIGVNAIQTASLLREILTQIHLPFYFETPTNQIFVILDDEKLEKLGQYVSYSFWEKLSGGHTVIRLATSWASSENDIEMLREILEKILF